MKILIIGTGRSGKDTVAEILRDEYGLTFQSSSQAAADIFLYEKLKPEFGYETPEECYVDRHNHRVRWHDEISAYNTPDKAKLAKGILKDNDMYVGMRSKSEIEECRWQGLFDFVVWVDASERISYKEGKESMDITSEDADYILYNNKDLDHLRAEVEELWFIIKGKIDKFNKMEAEFLEQTFHAL